MGSLIERHIALLCGLALLLIWEATCLIFDISPFVVPRPSAIFQALQALTFNGVIGRNLWITLIETLNGFAIAAVLGGVLGAFISESNLARRILLPYLVALQTVPKIAIAPILVLWFGFGLTSKIVIAATIAIFPVLINTIEGLGSTDPNRIDMLRAAGANRKQILSWIKIPSALPFYFASLETAVVFSLLGAIVGEFVGSTGGLGNLILQYNSKMDIAAVFAILIVLGVLGFLLHRVVIFLRKRLVYWQ